MDRETERQTKPTQPSHSVYVFIPSGLRVCLVSDWKTKMKTNTKHEMREKRELTCLLASLPMTAQYTLPASLPRCFLLFIPIYLHVSLFLRLFVRSFVRQSVALICHGARKWPPSIIGVLFQPSFGGSLSPDWLKGFFLDQSDAFVSEAQSSLSRLA